MVSSRWIHRSLLGACVLAGCSSTPATENLDSGLLWDAKAPALDAPPDAHLAIDVGPTPEGATGHDGDGAPAESVRPDARSEGSTAACAPVRNSVDGSALPEVVEHEYLDLARIARISKFRSGIGHDYWDGAETCRSMKHYMEPKDMANAKTIAIYAPITGRVVRTEDEWAGTQLHLASDRCAGFTIILFHVNLTKPLAVGDQVTAGQALGTHIGSQTMSDVAVAQDGPNGFRLHSYFEVMPDKLFAEYMARGVTSRAEFVISKALRDASPLQCSGEQFASEGSLPNWVALQ